MKKSTEKLYYLHAKNIFRFLFAIMREMDNNFRIYKNFWWKKYFHHILLIKQLNRSELPANWKLEKIEVFIKNLQ
jgi:hypothetical protein